jgi:glucose/arabinose dehydrogenase
MYAAPTRPLVLGDDVYVATRFGVYHGSPAGWSLLTLSPSGEPRHIAQGGDADLFVTTDDGKIYRRVCP